MKRIARIILSVMFSLPMLVGGAFMLSTNNNKNFDDLNKNTVVETLNPNLMGGGANLQ